MFVNYLFLKYRIYTEEIQKDETGRAVMNGGKKN